MEKLINTRCEFCGEEKDYLLNKKEREKLIDEIANQELLCEFCGSEMKLFNFARHFKYYFMDEMKG